MVNSRQRVANRIMRLCDERNLALNALANRSAVPPSTLKSIINGDSKNPGLVTIKLLCDGLGISLFEFFDDESFKTRDLEDI